MPADAREGSRLRRAGRLGTVLAGLQLAALLAAQRAFAAPSPSAPASPSGSPGPSSSPCNVLPLPGSDVYCAQGGGSGSLPGSGTVGSVTDPLGSLARACAQAAAWVVRNLSSVIDSTTQVDFTNTDFLTQYAVVFAASSVLTLVLWLLAVTKRAVRGVPLSQAFSEAIGFLWLTVIASAFTPLCLYTLVGATDGLTAAIAAGTKSGTSGYLSGFADTLEHGTIGGGPLILVLVSLVAVLAAVVLWIELWVRTAMLYVGALLGTAVYAGLVDKQLWKHVRRWAGLMAAIDLAKPVIVIILGLAQAVAGSAGASDDFSRVLAGLAILFLSIFASSAIYRFVPGFGDEMMQLRHARASAVSAGQAMINGPANLVKQGISTHGSRGSAETANASGGSGSGGGSVATGIAAHASRTPAAPPPPAAPPAQPPAQNPAKGG